jgi:hypothetical protein
MGCVCGISDCSQPPTTTAPCVHITTTQRQRPLLWRFRTATGNQHPRQHSYFFCLHHTTASISVLGRQIALTNLIVEIIDVGDRTVDCVGFSRELVSGSACLRVPNHCDDIAFNMIGALLIGSPPSTNAQFDRDTCFRRQDQTLVVLHVCIQPEAVSVANGSSTRQPRCLARRTPAARLRDPQACHKPPNVAVRPVKSHGTQTASPSLVNIPRLCLIACGGAHE